MSDASDAIQKLVGRKLVRRKNGKQETRWVYDRTLGNSVCWVDRWHGHHQTPWAEFKPWADEAKIVG